MAFQPRLKADIWVAAHIRRCHNAGTPAYLVRRGDEMAGSVLLKINRFAEGCIVLTPVTTAEGSRAWMRGTGEAPVPEADADAYIARQLNYDPDLWVVEIEDLDGRHALDEPIL